MLPKEQILKIADVTIKNSKNDFTEVVIDNSDKIVTRWANNTIHQNTADSNTHIYIRVAQGKKIAHTTTNSTNTDLIQEILKSVTEICKTQKEIPYLKNFPEPQKYTIVNSFVPATAEYTPQMIANDVEKMVKPAKDKNLNSSGAFTTVASEIVVANSLGVRAYYPYTSAYLTNTVLSDDANGFSNSFSYDVRKLEINKVAQEATEKCLKSTDAIELQPGEYDVLLSPNALYEILVWLSFTAFGATFYQDGRSFMCGRMNQKLASEKLTIYDDPSEIETGFMPFDFEGTSKKRIYLIRDGIAENVVYDTLTASKEGKKSTGHAIPSAVSWAGPMPINLCVQPGSVSLDDLIKSIERGIFVTRFHYINGLLNTREAVMTGMTRGGTFLIEQGKLKQGIKNLRFTESMLKAFSNIVNISKERKICSMESIAIGLLPYVHIKNFNFSSKTEY